MIKEKIKNNIFPNILLLFMFLLTHLVIQNAEADTITFKFKNPSFSGVGTSSHYLTIENQEHLL